MPLTFEPKQREALEILNGNQRHTLLAGGSRSGKTFLLTSSTVIRALKAPRTRHAIFRFRANAVWTSIGLDTLPKVCRIIGIPLTVKAQDRYFVLPNGSEIWLAGLDDKDRVEKILGMEFLTTYFNESSQIPYSSYLVAKTRLAQVSANTRQRVYVDLNPCGTAHWTHRLFIQKVDPDSRIALANPDEYRSCFINPSDNAANLSLDYLNDLKNLPERQRRRFWDGKYTDEIDGALWPLELIDKCRCENEDIPEMVRVVVAIDPSGTKGDVDDRSDDVGIIVAGKGIDGRAYVLADRTCNLSPAGWGRVAVAAYKDFDADCIIAERNYGGAMVEHVIRTTDDRVPYREVVASRGKAVRAEPVSTLYERDLVRHVGRFSDLEDQMSNFSTSGYLGDKSPDRVDAMVWALSELMLGEMTNGRALFELVRRESREKPEAPKPPVVTYAPGSIEFMKALAGEY